MCHETKEHGLENSFMKVKCPLCDISVLSKKSYYDHLSMKHAVSIASEETEFASFQEFSEWKKQTERKTLSLYVKKCGSYRTSDNVNRHSLVCHRSGQYVSNSKGIRRMKIQGTNKIEGVCPSSIEVTEAGDGSCKVKYVVTHVGHQDGVRHLNLTEEERNTLAVDIANKVPLQAILDIVRDTLSDSMPERIHLLTKKDLYDTEQCNNLRSEVMRQKDDGISVEAWVNEINASVNPCVLFYKPQDTSSQSHPLLRSEDFVHIIMNNAQCEILKKYGSDCICIDGTHGTNGYCFELITLLVLDDMRQGFPCAFLISNRSDQDVLSLYFNEIKTKVGKVRPQVFMSDLAESFYNALLSQTEEPVRRLYCSCHTDRAWRKNICIKTKSKERQVETYKLVRSLMQERDVVTFEHVFPLAPEHLVSDPVTAEFGFFLQ
ncbi:uncharacterized protein LOC126253607 [Schistocerca nitens]|uniref:uncharacterized protein LOC126253607 n=1 Tax=Schistocerca nitens TaxID=7011 RepID=UPI00211823BC|nr:uncharacterized protein LOC126253607 [Schistocerca nitens]